VLERSARPWGWSLRLGYCTVLYCAVLYCAVLYCIVLHCTVLYCAVLCGADGGAAAGAGGERGPGVEPEIGVRAKLSTRAQGHWADTAGDKGKFGLTATQMIDAVNTLKEVRGGMPPALPAHCLCTAYTLPTHCLRTCLLVGSPLASSLCPSPSLPLLFLSPFHSSSFLLPFSFSPSPFSHFILSLPSSPYRCRGASWGA